MIPESLKDLIKSLSKIPGVGEKTAQRYAFQLLSFSKQDLKKIREQLLTIESLNFCSHCGFITEKDLCHICLDPHREQDFLCIVESMSDLLAMEKSGVFQGCYFILKQILNPLKGIGPSDLPIGQLKKLIDQKEIKKILLALGSSLEAETTCFYLRELFKDQVQIERIGLGLPAGGHLEYFDSYTIAKAFDHRQSF